ncbi:hemerythrin domain-containing protein [Streptacidiphilus fuscans]|uniref:Hemerythrin domain-containing protein n=1 Tax=Streptacidiphilus fuscans TaxID=2789292 RepID=A0A931BAZ6_9ACTN|nr:hemerythrin domain-containing protein [Streptacidiphilus fuscans]MBF9068894.1 hemerythrin domain-containing protein [Streptacidiphilus fuscans]MBF9073348.1 hemerythrin domain-containing protein [Streptacidiphilus fuscans]
MSIETHIDRDRAQGDLLDGLIADHEEITRTFSAFLGVGFGHPERKEIADQVTRQIVAHDAIEEALVYPMIRERTEGGSAMAVPCLGAHAQTDVLLRRIRLLDAHAPGFDRLMGVLGTHVTGHMHWEEAQVFPLLRATLDQEELDQLGDRARGMRRHPLLEPAPHPGIEPPADDYRPAERTTTGKLRYLFTPAGGWDRMRPH